jgi:hypothetical protein
MEVDCYLLTFAILLLHVLTVEKYDQNMIINNSTTGYDVYKKSVNKTEQIAKSVVSFS